MEKLYYIINELIKSYHVFCKFDKARAAEILTQINKYRLQIAILADQRQIFIEQLNIPANASGYKQDVFFTHDDIDSLVVGMLAYLTDGALVSLVQQGTRENLFTRQQIKWQHLMAEIQNPPIPSVGSEVLFDFPQEIYLEKAQTLDIGVTANTTAGHIFVRGANLKDDAATNPNDLLAEIQQSDFDGSPLLPQTQVVPIQYKFTAAVLGNNAVSVDGGDEIFSIKSDRSVILTEVSRSAVHSRITLQDKGRNQLICDTVEANGIAGFLNNPYQTYYPLPYPHLLRKQDRLQLKSLNGSPTMGSHDDADTIYTLCFRGFTI